MCLLPKFLLGLALRGTGARARRGYLASKPEKLPDMVLGLGEAGYGVSQKDFALSTGKAYRLKIKSTGQKECAWQAPQFVNFIWLRKVEVNKVEIKASHVYEIEMERGRRRKSSSYRSGPASTPGAAGPREARAWRAGSS